MPSLTPLWHHQNCNQNEKLYAIIFLLIGSEDCNFVVPGCHFQNLPCLSAVLQAHFQLSAGALGIKVGVKERHVKVLFGARSHDSFQNCCNILALFLLKSEVFRRCLISSCGLYIIESHLRLKNERKLWSRKKGRSQSQKLICLMLPPFCLGQQSRPNSLDPKAGCG